MVTLAHFDIWPLENIFVIILAKNLSAEASWTINNTLLKHPPPILKNIFFADLHDLGHERKKIKKV